MFPCNNCPHPCAGIKFLDCPDWCEWAAEENAEAEEEESEELSIDEL